MSLTPSPEINPPIEQAEEPSIEEEFELSICSKLSFDGVNWPEEMSDDERNAFALALNITGSFEGPNGWANLTNNFDGQGLSMGLFNQTLGTGSLQPLWAQLRDEHPEVYDLHFSAEQKTEIFQMLDNYSRLKISQANLFDKEPSPIPIERVPVTAFHSELNQLDPSFAAAPSSNIETDNIEKYYTLLLDTQLMSVMSVRSADSVEWAINTLYQDSGGRNFKPAWKTALKNMAADPAYTSIQMNAAERLHYKAQNYQDELDLNELNAYLVFVDVVVQNGGFYQRNITQYREFASENHQLSPLDKLLELIEIRVVESNPRWQEDVRKRKRTVAFGVGTVHGRQRNLPEEYCY